MEKHIIVLLCIVAISMGQHATKRPYQPIEQDCLKCLCQADSGCTNANCMEEPTRYGGGKACGWYKINYNYYTGGCSQYGRQRDEPKEEAHERCASEKDCAEICINLWLVLGKQCDPAGGEPTISECERHARKHYGGPGGCWKPATDEYWKKVKTCLKGN